MEIRWRGEEDAIGFEYVVLWYLWDISKEMSNQPLHVRDWGTGSEGKVKMHSKWEVSSEEVIAGATALTDCPGGVYRARLFVC